MKALRVANGKLSLSNVPVPSKEGEALVRVLKSGICNTDLEIIGGYGGFEGTIGHEFVGVVEEADRPKMLGKRVVGEINVGCGSCDTCANGDPRHCAKRTVLGIYGRDGAHAELLRLPADNLLVVPDKITDDEAVFAEPLAAAISITDQVEIGSGTRVGVVGDGKLGLLCAMALALRSANVVLVGKHASKLSVARNRGIETVILPNVRSLNRDFDVVVEASGSESGFQTALGLARPRGKIVLKSTFHGRTRWEPWRIVVDELTIVGSRCGRLGPALELLASRQIQPLDLISDEYRLNDGIAAVKRAGEDGALKVLLSMND